MFAHGKGFISWAIRFMQAFRSPKIDANWNHVAILARQVDGEWWVYQAEGKGVVYAPLTHVAPGGHYKVMPCPSSANAAMVVEFARSQVGIQYGFLTIASIVFNIITPRRIAIRKPGTWICSALAAGALWYAGWPFSVAWNDIYQVSPADLFAHIA